MATRADLLQKVQQRVHEFRNREGTVFEVRQYLHRRTRKCINVNGEHVAQLLNSLSVLMAGFIVHCLFVLLPNFY